MLIYFLTGLVTMVLSFFYLGNPVTESLLVLKTWEWDKSARTFVQADDKTELTEKLNGYRKEDNLWFFNYRQPVKIENEYLYEIPLLGSGYYQYKKVGSEISYFSPSGEILWKKEYKSYPRAGSRLILLLTGDNNQVQVADLSGNLLNTLDGRFLTDYAFDADGGAALLFGGGDFYILDKKGKTVLSKHFRENGFYKSLAVSPDGNYFAVHYRENGRDFISVFTHEKEIHTLPLEKSWPHKLWFAISNSKTMVVNLPDKWMFVDDDGEVVKSEDRVNNLKPGNYYPAMNNGRYFMSAAPGEIRISGPYGDKIAGFDDSALIWRSFSLGNDSFVVETMEKVFIYSFF